MAKEITWKRWNIFRIISRKKEKKNKEKYEYNLIRYDSKCCKFVVQFVIYIFKK